MASYSIGRYLLLAILVALIAALSAFATGYAGTVSNALIVAAVIAGIFAGWEQYRITGSVPGPALTGGTLVTAVVGLLLGYLPGLLGADTTYAKLVWAIGFLYALEQMEGGPAIPGLPGSTASAASAPPKAS